jgi:hypothetical protein
MGKAARLTTISDRGKDWFFAPTAFLLESSATFSTMRSLEGPFDMYFCPSAEPRAGYNVTTGELVAASMRAYLNLHPVCASCLTLLF